MEGANWSRVESTTKNELVLLLLDGSGSMRQPAEISKQSGPSKSDMLNFIVKDVLKRINKSQASNMFRVGIIRFGHQPIVEQFDNDSYFSVENAIEILRPSTEDFSDTEITDIKKAIERASEILNEFYEDDDLAPEKHCTLILFSDGKHFEHEINEENRIEELINLDLAVKRFKSVSIAPRVACVSLGTDAEINTLIGISTEPDGDQLRSLDKNRLLEYLKKDNKDIYKLCIVGHNDDNIGMKEVDVIRRFLIIGTKTN